MSDISLKLTAYFAERQRSGDRFLAESMLDLFAEREVEISVMLRGISGFGHRRIIRTDESLTLSEDPAVVVAAVDRPPIIQALAGDIAAMTTSGMITLERARLLHDDIAPHDDTVKLTVCVGRNRRANGVAAYKAVCDLLHRNGFAGASAFLGVDGTVHGRRERAHFIARNVDVPVMIIGVGSARQLQRCAGDLAAILGQPLATVERSQLCKNGGWLYQRPAPLPDADGNGRPLWQKLMVFTAESDRHDGVPVHRALVRRLWQSRAASGVTVLRGVWGFHGDREPHGDRVFQFGRQVPVMTVIVDTPERITASFDVVDELTSPHGLVIAEMVPALLALDGGQQRGGTDLADFRY